MKGIPISIDVMIVRICTLLLDLLYQFMHPFIHFEICADLAIVKSAAAENGIEIIPTLRSGCRLDIGSVNDIEESNLFISKLWVDAVNYAADDRHLFANMT